MIFKEKLILETGQRYGTKEKYDSLNHILNRIISVLVNSLYNTDKVLRLPLLGLHPPVRCPRNGSVPENLQT